MRVGFVSMILTFLAMVLMGRQLIERPPAPPAPPTIAIVSGNAADTTAMGGAPLDESDDATDAVDVYGNEITDAVARYRFDSTGSLYELHSPRTEVPHLGPPTS